MGGVEAGATPTTLKPRYVLTNELIREVAEGTLCQRRTNPGQVGVFEFRVGVGEERGLLWGGAFRVKNERERHEC